MNSLTRPPRTASFVNLVIWQQVFERHAALAQTAALLGVDGRIQRAEGVIHLIAEALSTARALRAGQPLAEVLGRW